MVNPVVIAALCCVVCSDNAVIGNGGEAAAFNNKFNGSDNPVEPPNVPGPTYYTVEFSANGGSGTVSSQSAQTGTSITLPSGSGLSRDGYYFGGWNTEADGSGTTYSTGSFYTPTGNNITLYATWKDASDVGPLVLTDGEAWIYQDSGFIFTPDNRLIEIFTSDGGWWYTGIEHRYQTTGNIITINSIAGIYSVSGNTLYLDRYSYTFTRTSVNPQTAYYLNISVSDGNSSSGGSVFIAPEKKVYSFGEQVTVTATAIAAAGYGFIGWSGESMSYTDASLTIMIDGNVTLTANFRRYALTINANDGTVSRDPEANSSGYYPPGTAVTVTAVAAAGYEFTGWSGALESTDAAVTITMGSDKTLIANFERLTSSTGTFTDIRNNKTYKTITLKDSQMTTWMAENLNYDIPGVTTDVCYGNNAANCTKYGRLYDWNTAKEACPAGWHLSSDAEWAALVYYADYASTTAGKKLKSTSGWNDNGNGTDEFGFSALPGGRGYSAGGFGDGAGGGRGYWWSATESNASNAWYRSIDYSSESVDRGSLYKTSLFSVRCVADQ